MPLLEGLVVPQSAEQVPEYTCRSFRGSRLMTDVGLREETREVLKGGSFIRFRQRTKFGVSKHSFILL